MRRQPLALATDDVTALIELRGVSCAYNAAQVLGHVDLIVAPGQFTGIVGPSGSGKTTLLKALLGTMAPTGGTVSRATGLRVGYVPQVETVDWSFPVTVAECVLMARVNGLRLPWPSRSERASPRRTCEWSLAPRFLFDEHWAS